MRLQLGHGGVVFLFDILSSEWYYRPNQYCHWHRWNDLVVVIVVESKNMHCYGSNSTGSKGQLVRCTWHGES